MKKAIFAALTLALALGAFQDSWAAGRTSTNLATTTNLINNISQPDGGIPVGTVISWPYAALPSDGNWRECNGQSVAGTSLCSTLGQCTAPDYRGIFLRGYGTQQSNHFGNVSHSSGALGVTQGDAIRALTGYGKFYITTTFGESVKDAINGVFKAVSGDCGNCKNAKGTGGGGTVIEMNVANSSPTANEMRPVNKAVKYIIKVN